MFFAINWIISIVVFILVAAFFNFKIIGWILGIITSYIYKEFIGPLLIVKTGDEIIKKSEPQIKKQSLTDFSQITKNFNFEDNRGSNYCIYYYHKNNDKLYSHAINFQVSLVQYKNELFRLSLKMIYDIRKKGSVTDVIFNGKSINVYDSESHLNFHRNEGHNSENYFSITTRKNHQNDLTNNNGKLQIIFEDGAEILTSDDLAYQSFYEGFILGIYLNQN